MMGGNNSDPNTKISHVFFTNTKLYVRESNNLMYQLRNQLIYERFQYSYIILDFLLWRNWILNFEQIEFCILKKLKFEFCVLNKFNFETI